ncbi:hypothetical protein Hanom_Chr15g01378621 [Helianthus anomalus]
MGGDTTRTVDALSSRFKVIHLDCERFEMVHTVVENAGDDLGEKTSYESLSSTSGTTTTVNFDTFRRGRLLDFLYSNV